MGALRVLAVQTRPEWSSEASVLRTLLAAADSRSDVGVLDVLLCQGVDSASPTGHQTADAFTSLRHVSLHRLRVGSLGRQGLSGGRRALKVIDVTRLYRQWGGLLAVADAFDPHLVYSAQQRWDQQVASRLAERLACPRVVHLHYTVGPWLGKNAVRSLLTAEGVIAVSDFIRENAVNAGVASGCVETLYNPIDPIPEPSVEARETARQRLRAELSVPVHALVVGMVARLSASKCQTSLLEAMVPILRRDHGVHLAFAGEEYPSGNGMAAQIVQIATEAKVSSQVHLLGQRQDVPTLLDAFDVFAHPTLSEPCAVAVLEAMAHGLPVVAWADGGTVDLVQHGRTGTLVPVGDIRALTDAIDALVVDQARREELGAAGRARAQSTFHPGDASARFLELLGSVAGPVQTAKV
jgi:glycosyltransferase involved in cell wall biosynthesis